MRVLQLICLAGMLSTSSRPAKEIPPMFPINGAVAMHRSMIISLAGTVILISRDARAVWVLRVEDADAEEYRVIGGWQWL